MRRVVGGLVGMVLALGVGIDGPAGAQDAPPISAGCQELNDQKYDAVYGLQVITAEFFAGETITVTATAPPETGNPTFVILNVSEPGFGPLIGSGSVFYPGTATFTIPETRSVAVQFGVAFSATDFITVTCTAAPYPLAVNVARPALAGQHASMLLPLDDSSESSGSNRSAFGMLVGIVAMQMAGVGLYRRRQAT